jgi:hypothetical protein
MLHSLHHAAGFGPHRQVRMPGSFLESKGGSLFQSAEGTRCLTSGNVRREPKSVVNTVVRRVSVVSKTGDFEKKPGWKQTKSMTADPPTILAPRLKGKCGTG